MRNLPAIALIASYSEAYSLLCSRTSRIALAFVSRSDCYGMPATFPITKVRTKPGCFIKSVTFTAGRGGWRASRSPASARAREIQLRGAGRIAPQGVCSVGDGQREVGHRI